MPHPKRLDHSAILADHAAGLTRTQLAAKYQAHKSTIRWHLLRNSEPPKINGEARTADPPQPMNGHPTLPAAELEQLLLKHWNRLPLVERVRILLARA